MAAAAADAIEIRPQPGPQEQFLATPADIAIYGGAAGGGKSWALLLEPLRHVDNPDFGAVIFRRTYAQITNEGGLWDESMALYPLVGADPIAGDLWYRFPSGARVSFGHLQHEKSVYDHQGSQIPLIGLDELTHFTEFQFFYMLSRNRSTCGVQPYVRATTNPDADSWVAKLIAWWIDQESGYPIAERAGVLRWFVRIGQDIVWADTRDELLERYPDVPPKSLTFIPAKLEDNKILMEKDPGYRANLMAQTLVERERLLGGNWKIRPTAGKVFNRGWFEVVDHAPPAVKRVRAWDVGATKGDGDRSAGVLMALGRDQTPAIESVVRGQWDAGERDRTIVNTAKADGKGVTIVLPQDPGAAGKAQKAYWMKMLQGFDVRFRLPTGDKLTRAAPFASQAEHGGCKLVRGPWNEEYLTELHNFEGAANGIDDQVDASSDAFAEITHERSMLDDYTGSSYASA